MKTSLFPHEEITATRYLLYFLIDDDPDEWEIFRLALKKNGEPYSFLTAENGMVALQILKKVDVFPDAIFLDLNMPIIDGKECLREIRKMNHLRSVPVIIYSTSTNELEIEELRLMGADHFISKASNIDDFAKTLKTIASSDNLPYYINTA